MGSKKKIAAFFRREAAKLAPETYQAFHRYSEMEYHQDGDTARPVYGEIGHHPVNHGRRLKRLYLRHGKEAVDNYFGARGFKLQKREDEHTEYTEVNNVQEP